MDVLRSAHTAPAVISTDGLTESKIRWYRCKPGAQAFPGFHAFGSAVWEPFPDEWTEGAGVHTGPLVWKPASIQAPPGTEYHGKKEWYERGIPREVLDNPEPFFRDPCIPPPIPAGVVAGMAARRSLPPNMCPECAEGVYLPPVIRLRFTEVVLTSNGNYLHQPPEYITMGFALYEQTYAYGNALAGRYSAICNAHCNYNGAPGLTFEINVATLFGIPITDIGEAYGDWQYSPTQVYQSSQQFRRVYGCNAEDLLASQIVGRCGWQQSGESVVLTVSIEPAE